jgi:tRNA-Thr(GGU) m(6)t(6)A37 methyltransferase TsaA
VKERELVLKPIGFARTPFAEKADAPRQGVLAEDVVGHIEMLPEHERALDDLDGFDRIWILFWFDRTEGARPASKVLPPRSDVKRGVFATRSPHRPNPIGMTAARLDRVEGLVLHVRDLDLVDGTPVLDIKPYIPYADAFPESRAGWLEATAPRDPGPAYEVRFEPRADEQLAWIAENGGGDLRERIALTLALGPQPHPYRRIKKSDDGKFVLAQKEWRIRFTIDERVVTVLALSSGWRAREIDAHPLHAAFAARFSHG